MPPNQSGSRSLLRPGRPVDRGALEPEQPQRPGRRREVECRSPPTAAEPRVQGQLPSARRHRQQPQDDHQVGPVVVEVRGRQQQVVGDDRERRRRRQAGEQAERHGHGGHRRQPEQPDVDRLGQLRIPGGVGLVEGVPVGLPVQAVGEERRQMQEHDRAGQHPQQGERPHADRTAEQVVERGDHAAEAGRRTKPGRAHPAPSRTGSAGPRPGVGRRCARRSPWPPGTGSHGRAECCLRPSRARTRETPAGCRARRSRGGGARGTSAPRSAPARPSGTPTTDVLSGRAGRRR